VDFYLSETRDREAAKSFLKRPWRIRTIGRLEFSPGTDCGAIPRISETCKGTVICMAAAGNALEDTETTGSNRTIINRSLFPGPQKALRIVGPAGTRLAP
jgi:hypothetical protein